MNFECSVAWRLEHEHGCVLKIEIDILRPTEGGSSAADLKHISAAIHIIERVLLAGKAIEVAVSEHTLLAAGVSNARISFHIRDPATGLTAAWGLV